MLVRPCAWSRLCRKSVEDVHSRCSINSVPRSRTPVSSCKGISFNQMRMGSRSVVTETDSFSDNQREPKFASLEERTTRYIASLKYKPASSNLMRSLNGIICIDKPAGRDTTDLVTELKSKIALDCRVPYDNVKMGHAGSLDHFSAGVLVLGIGSGCKQLQAVQNGPKNFLVVAKLGSSTTTDDSSGDPLGEFPYSHVTKEAIEFTLKTFQRSIIQRAPAYATSASTPLPPVTIHRIRLISFNLPYLTIEISCGSKAHIRTLIADIGSAVRSAAHVVSLTRTGQGPYDLNDCLQARDWSLDGVSSAISRLRKSKC